MASSQQKKSKKRIFNAIEEEQDAVDSVNEEETKKQKMDPQNDDMQLDDNDKTETPAQLIQNIVNYMLIFLYDVPAAIVKIILEYNEFNIWYKNGVRFEEWNNFDQKIDPLCVVDYDTQFVRIDKRIWCKGSNCCAELGLGHSRYCRNFVTNDSFIQKAIQIKNIFATFSNFTLWQSETDQVYGCGRNRDNQFGFGRQRHYIDTPELIEGIHHIQQISIGNSHCLFLDIFGNVFSTKCYGVHHFGQNGAGEDNFSNKNDKFQKIEFFKNHKIKQISAGEFHSLFVQQNGVLWTCGKSDRGQLGHGNRFGSLRAYPKKVEYLIQNKIKIKKCRTGDHHNLLLDEGNNVYSFGCNRFGQCGLNSTHEHIALPTIIEMSEKIESIQCGCNHSYIKTVKNVHYLFGSNQNSQCLIKNPSKLTILKPLAVNDIVQNNAIGVFIQIKEFFICNNDTIIKILQMK